MESLRGTRRPCALGREWTTVFCAILLSAAGYLDSLSSAQSICGVAQTTPIRVGPSTELGTLRAAVNCTGGGTVEVDLAGVVILDSPISIADGTSLSMTGEDDLAEVRGGDSQVNGTRLFEVSPGGGLNLTKIKVSGGSAGEGGAIYSSSGTLTFGDCVFEANAATDGNGGAVWASGGDVTIVGGVFLANTAFRYGGAVHATDGVLEVQGGARFEDNEAPVAGALFCGSTAEGSASSAVLCSLTEAEFSSNRATFEHQDEDETASLHGGGAAAFHLADATVTECVFNGNYAATSGGALFGGPSTNVMVDGCTFGTNTAEENGGALSASFMTLGGGTRLANNSASNDGGAVYGWDPDGTIVFDDVVCTNNSAIEHGGCLHSWGKVIINDGTVMLNNHADRGGGISTGNEGGDILVNGGEFTGGTCSRGGFLYAGDNTTVKITGGLFADNTVTRRGGALYVSGKGVLSDISIEGGTFRDNTALEGGGAIAAWGASVLLTITGGTFANNTASFFGGFVFLELGASIHCAGATISGNFAGEQGGGFYARDTMFVNSSCDLIANESPQGAAIYLADVTNAAFENHNVTGNRASSGGVVHVVVTAVVARGVRFESSFKIEEYSINRAIQLDENTTLHAEECVFDGWPGDTVIYHLNFAKGSLVLDSCDFSGIIATMAVVSPASDAEIRNAIVSSVTFENAEGVECGSHALTLVDRALNCSDYNACGPGECVDSALGVLCECLEGGECLDDGGDLSLTLKTSAEMETFRPEEVSYEVMVSSAFDGTTYAIWYLGFERGDLDLKVFPFSGLLPPGGSITLNVTGTPWNQDVAGYLTSSFYLRSIGSTSTGSEAVDRMEVFSTFYLCEAYEYAMPLDGNGDDANEFLCEQCASIEGVEGVECETPGATLASLPIRPGYWRLNRDSLVIHECLHADACVGAAAEVSSADGYCDEGYSGPYCAVCAEGYGRSLSNTCHSCNGTWARLLNVACALFSVLTLLLLSLAVVFLVGGTEALRVARQRVIKKLSVITTASNTWRPVKEKSFPRRKHFEESAVMDSMGGTNSRAFDATSDVSHRGKDAGNVSGRGSTVNPSWTNDPGLMYPRTLSAVVGVGVGVGRSNATRIHSLGIETMPPARNTPESPLAAAGVSSPDRGRRTLEVGASHGGKSTCCGLGKHKERWSRRFPLGKLKIMVGVWQILAVYSSITGVDFPASYSVFLSWINVVNFDLGYILSASCVLPSVNFYRRLLATTLAPFVVAAGLVWTFRMANKRVGIGSAGVIARQAAWSRHVAAGLLLTFVVFTSASSTVLKTFACDDNVVEGESYLRADYNISCKTPLHAGFMLYAGLMILVYPIGIPVLYFSVLWRKRELLNPRIYSVGTSEGDGASEDATGAGFVRRMDSPSAILLTASNGQTKAYWSPQELEELNERVKTRAEHPELAPFVFLWRGFAPNLYYYEVVECGRRILLTEVLIFIAPQSAMQAAMACIFAFISLLAFELLRPHVDSTDSWLYRLGCVLIFMSYFLALLIKMDVAGEANRSALGGVLVAVNVFLILAVLCTAWFSMRRMGAKHHDDEGNPSDK